MAVFVWETGTVVSNLNPGKDVDIEINNRTRSPQTGRAILWNMATSPKTLVQEIIFTAPPDTSIHASPINITGVTLDHWAVEVRLPNPHMVVTSYDNPELPDVLAAPGAWFRDSDPNETP